MNIRISPFHDKRGFEKLFQFVIYLVIVIMILLGLLQFINNYSSGEAVKEQILAKQIALAIDAAKPGTEIVITKGKFLVSINNKEVNARAKEERQGYTYPFFTQNRIETEQKEGILNIKIS